MPTPDILRLDRQRTWDCMFWRVLTDAWSCEHIVLTLQTVPEIRISVLIRSFYKHENALSCDLRSPVASHLNAPRSTSSWVGSYEWAQKLSRKKTVTFLWKERQKLTARCILSSCDTNLFGFCQDWRLFCLMWQKYHAFLSRCHIISRRFLVNLQHLSITETL